MSLGLSGLVNLGNTCYMNSVIQCLSNIDLFRTPLLLKRPHIESKIVTKNLITLISEMWKEMCIISPKTFKKSINNKLTKFANYDQHDAHEFLLDLLNVIHNDTLQSVVKFKDNTLASKYVQQANFNWNNHFPKTSLIAEIFYGQLVKKYTCRGCEHVHKNFDIFNSLCIPIVKKDYYIKDLLKRYFETVYQYLSCSNCGKEDINTDEHIVNTEIYKLPTMLILSLNRFSGSNSGNINYKNENNVYIDDSLDLSEYYASTDSTSVHYTLHSIICHNGRTIDSGHYFTIVKNEGNECSSWKCFDDNLAIVKQFDINITDLACPYIIIYEQKKN